MNKYMNVATAGLPVVFAFVTTFFTYKSIRVFLILALGMLAFCAYNWWRLASEQSGLAKKLSAVLPFALVFVGSIGTAAAAVLTIEKIELLKSPSHITSCSVSPIVACSPVINSPEASVFGIPNPVIGIFAFGALIIAGMSLLAGGKFASWWWRFLWLGTLFGFVFVLWLFHETVFEIGSLCIYCMVAWSVTIPIFFYVTLYNLQNGHLNAPRKFVKMFEKYHYTPTLAVYALIIGVILNHFWYYWKTLI